MTFLACYQAILQSDLRGDDFFTGSFLSSLLLLSQDQIVDVRLRVARLLGTFSGAYSRHGNPDCPISKFVADKQTGLPQELSQVFHELAVKLSQDPSNDVKAFAEPLVAHWPPTTSHRKRAAKSAANFSRPPPPPVAPS